MKEELGLKLYTAKELAEEDNSYYMKIKSSKDYIPVKIENSKNKYEFRTWRIKKDYSIKYIRRKDIEKFLKNKE